MTRAPPKWVSRSASLLPWTIWFAGRVKEEIARHEKIIAQYPQNELARFSLAKAHFDAGDFATAAGHFQKAVEQKPDWMVAHILLGKCRLTLGARDAARVSFERARELAIAQDHAGPKAEMDQALAELE